MRVIDARTGEEVEVGDTVSYGPDDWWKLIDVEHGWTSAKALVKGQMDGQRFGPKWLPLKVRFTHPGFFLQRVAFAPT
jgi:hypothetical protein